MSNTSTHKSPFFHIEQSLRKVKEYTMLQFKEQGFPITIDQWLVVKRIAESETSNQREIAESTFKDPAALTRILDLLEKKQLVKRFPSKNDRRSYEVQLSVEGSRLHNRMLPLVEEIKTKALRGISSAELQQMQSCLQKINNNLV